MAGLGIGMGLKNTLRSGVFSPHKLHQDGDITLWYDPSDLTTMFQDVAGTSPVTADGQSVLLMLDKGQWGGKTLAQVLAAQAELVTNGTFDSDVSGWSTPTDARSTNTWVDGKLRVTHVGAGFNGYAFQTIATVVGRRYMIRWTPSAVTTGYPTRVFWGNSEGSTTGGGASTAATVSGPQYITFVATATTTFVAVQLFTPTTLISYDFDNISIKEIPGYHRTQATPSQAPKYKTDGTLHWLLYDGTDDGNVTPTINWDQVTSDGAARRNLLANPKDILGSPWNHNMYSNWVNAGSRANDAVAPDGTTTADVMVLTSSIGNRMQRVTGLSASTTYVFSCYVKATDINSYASGLVIRVASGLNGVLVSTAFVVVDITASLTSEWVRVSASFTIPGSGVNEVSVGFSGSQIGSAPNAEILLWGAQLELGSTATAFQNIGSDEVAICAGVTKSSDGALAVFAEFSAVSATTAGTFALFAPGVGPGSPDYFMRSRGTATSNRDKTTHTAPTTDVVTGMGKIATDINRLRVNSVETTASTDQGTGNFGNHILYFGRRAGSSLPFNGKEHSFVARSRLWTAIELQQIENFVAKKTGVIL
jgi:hypothetical protein